MQIAILRHLRWLAVPLLATVAIFGLPVSSSLQAQTNASQQQNASDKPYAIEYYYKAKWGHAEEFIALFKKNHYPVLKKEIELGRILKVFAQVPRYHATEDGRWDFRTTIVFKNAQIANDNFDSSALLKQLFPDQDAYKKEEQRRFEILDGHWDVPIKDFDLDAR
ncbi:MAG: hypothetical protein JWO71_4457 [Candidatus Acidoferrum typicum]|nr:hypothetical protein [Candidatus Acidoferrum typicum]